MRLKHLEQGIHLPHTSKYHPDAIDIYWAIEKMAGVDRLHLVRRCLRKEVMEGRSGERNDRRRGWEKSFTIGKTFTEEPEKADLFNQTKVKNRTEVSATEYVCSKE